MQWRKMTIRATNSDPVFVTMMEKLSAIWKNREDCILITDTYTEVILDDVILCALVFLIFMQYFGVFCDILKLY